MPNQYSDKRLIPRPIIYPVGPSIAYVQLTQGQFACIDVEDAPEVGKYNWCALWCKNTADFRAMRNKRASEGGSRTVFMHAEIMGTSGSEITADHITPGNGLDNRRSNLRMATRSQQGMNTRRNRNNTSGFKGVTPRARGWQVRIGINGRNINLGFSKTLEGAIELRAAGAAKYHGEFARIA